MNDSQVPTSESADAEAGNPHLSIFRTYTRPPQHEDQLTRAALIVMRLVPQAHDALLTLIGDETLASLPKPRFDLQTELLVPPGADEGESDVQNLISVFLTPDETVEGLDDVIKSGRRARYDGVIQYGTELLVVLESKLVSGVNSTQAVQINPKGATWTTSTPVHVRWHELLDRWWDISESTDIDFTRREVIREFFDYAESYFGELLPFTHLGRCKTNQRRRLRRLRSVLHEAAGLAVVTTPGAVDPATLRKYPPGVNAKLPEAQVTAADRVGMWIEDDGVHVAMWLGELGRQYKYLYRYPDRVASLISLADQPGWRLVANLHIGYRFSRSFQRWYPARHLSGADYVRQWADDVDDHARQRTFEHLQGRDFRDWLTKRHYADTEDLKQLDSWLTRQSPNRKFHIRPSAQISRTWKLSEAVDLDTQGGFAEQVKLAINQMLEALDEPRLEQIQN